MRPSSRRAWLFLAWAAVLVLVLLLPLGMTDLAPPAQAKRLAASLDDAVAAALTDAGYANSDQIHVVPAEKQGDWSFGTAALLGTGPADAPPDIVFYIAQRDGKRWRAEIESTAAYGKLLRQAPTGLVPDVFLDHDGVRAQAGVQPPLWAMPVGFGETRENPGTYRLSSLGISFDDGSTESGFAIEPVDPENNCPPPFCIGPDDVVRAAASGYATTPCASGNELGPIVVIEHEGGWRTTYYHVDANLEVTEDFRGPIRQQEYLGYMGTNARQSCGSGGELYPERVTIRVTRMTASGERDVSLVGQSFGGWEFVEQTNGEGDRWTCLEKTTWTELATREERVVCGGDVFQNDGSRGKGVTFTQKPARPQRGEKVGVMVRNLPQYRSVTLAYYWLDPRTLEPRDRPVKEFQVKSANKAQYVTFEQPREIPSRAVKLCVRETRLVVPSPPPSIYFCN